MTPTPLTLRPCLAACLLVFTLNAASAASAAASAPASKPAAAAKPAASGAKATPAALPPAPVHAHKGAPHAEPQPLDNAHTPFAGEPFFLLTDASFGSGELARVRLEVNNPGAFEQVGGVDVRVYRVPDPLAFLQKQKNLHRIQVDAKPVDEGVANTLTHLWDSWSVKARLAWRQLFSSPARGGVVAQAPALHTPADLRAPSTFEDPPQYAPLPGMPVVDRFRYPVQRAQAIQPPKDLKLAGSSSEFINPTAGNVFVPVGKRAPGLYLVEAMAGGFRATTLLFVSDSVAITKVASDQMLVWAARRTDGAPVAGTQVVWTDGLGALKSGRTDAQGLAGLDRKAPEQSYVFGADPAGGVWISENFYYDSEIYAAKVYAVTDRPLYRPGDTVQMHVTGREFKSARQSAPLKDADLVLTVVDPAGQPVVRQTSRFIGTQGGDARFVLPENAPGGGYEMRLALGDDVYTAAFRVAEYQKPHFEIAVQPDKADFTTGQDITGKLQLNYPDGKPVANASVSLTARAQRLTMVEGELDYGGQFPLKLTSTELVTDASGAAKFSLPAADQPSRYLLTALATDGAAYRVRASRELLVERGSTSWRLTPDRQFSKVNETVNFRIAASQRNTALPGTGALPTASAASMRPVSWEWVRQENRQRADGTLAAQAESLPLAFPLAGSYTLTLRDERHRIVAATSHWVSGDGLKAPAGSIGIVFDHASYRAGDTAEALISFPEPVEHALLTLERDRVEATALLGQAAPWITGERVAPTQWKVRLPVRDTMSPNVTLSVAYLKNGDYVFQNQGLLVAQPRIELAFRTPKAVYAPGERVDVDISATLGGKPVAADVNVGVVDEMIYVLQPEIAPRIEDFFFHPRRDNVRTSASLSFIGYDLATSKLGNVPARGDVQQRAVKVLERPRREDVDTAAWVPRLTTDAAGHARFSFTMPDSLTRWRITGRAIDPAGDVGQQTAWVRSDKPFYAKWTSPDWQREGDQATAAIALFNQTGAEATVEWAATGPGVDQHASVTLKPGVNFVEMKLVADAAGALPLRLALKRSGVVVDQLDVPLRRLPVAWRAPRETLLDLGAASAAAPSALALPADATNVRLAFSNDAAAGTFSRWMDQLIEYPYGCVEQTASRMLPLSIALQSLSPAQAQVAPMLEQRLATARLRLAQMAGPNARFSWWGGTGDDAFLTAYAYYADWRATQALHVSLPESHWQRVLEVYAAGGASLPPLQRALALQWMQDMGLPVSTMVGALVDSLAPAASVPASASASPAPKSGAARYRASLVLDEQAPPDTDRDLALVLATAVAERAGVARSIEARARADAAAARLAPNDTPFVQALLMATQRIPATTAPLAVAQAGAQAPTFDRAQTLLWLQRALGRRPGAGAGAAPAVEAAFALPAPWVRATGPNGEAQWRWPAGRALPATLALPAGAHPAWAWVDYDSAEAATPALAAHLERRLYKLVTQPGGTNAGEASKAPRGAHQEDRVAQGLAPDAGRVTMRLEAVKPGSALDADALYLDEIHVSATQSMSRSLIEVALPPGGAVESSTWGISIEIDGKGLVLERATYQELPQGYAIPVEALPAHEPLVVRHLVRFSQRGQFKLPPVRLQRMYDPEAKAYEAAGGWNRVEVR
jgi:hypothetical protein